MQFGSVVTTSPDKGRSPCSNKCPMGSALAPLDAEPCFDRNHRIGPSVAALLCSPSNWRRGSGLIRQYLLTRQRTPTGSLPDPHRAPGGSRIERSHIIDSISLNKFLPYAVKIDPTAHWFFVGVSEVCSGAPSAPLSVLQSAPGQSRFFRIALAQSPERI